MTEDVDEADEMIIDLLRRQNEKLSSIKGWVTFLGVLALIGLVLVILDSCGGMLGGF